MVTPTEVWNRAELKCRAIRGKIRDIKFSFSNFEMAKCAAFKVCFDFGFRLAQCAPIVVECYSLRMREYDQNLKLLTTECQEIFLVDDEKRTWTVRMRLPTDVDFINI